MRGASVLQGESRHSRVIVQILGAEAPMPKRVKSSLLQRVRSSVSGGFEAEFFCQRRLEIMH